MKRLTVFLFAAAIMATSFGCNGGNCRLFRRNQPECVPVCPPTCVDDCCGAPGPMMTVPATPAPLPAPNITN